MNKPVFLVILILLVLSVFLTIFTGDLLRLLKTEGLTHWVVLALLIAGVCIGFLIDFYKKHHPKEYIAAEMVAYTPKNKYGWYGLLAFILIIGSVYVYALLLK